MGDSVEIRHPEHPEDGPSSFVTQIQFDEIWKPRGFVLVEPTPAGEDDDHEDPPVTPPTKAAPSATKTPKAEEAKNGR